MFSVIYSFKVKEGKVYDFERSWKGLTQLIYEYEGSLGSRLHKTAEHRYIAYAQWPDRDRWANSGSQLPDSSISIRNLMKDSCYQIETIFELDMVEDLLKTESYQ